MNKQNGTKEKFRNCNKTEVNNLTLFCEKICSERLNKINENVFYNFSSLVCFICIEKIQQGKEIFGSLKSTKVF